MTLYCEDCKWFRRASWSGVPKCASPDTAAPPREWRRLVARKYDKPVKSSRQSCSIARVTPCGEGAKFWEPRK